jgi:hypothetical protein
VQVHEHGLLELGLAVVDGDGVVVPVQAVDEALDAGLVDVPDVGRCLAGFLAEDDAVGVDEPERVDDDFALDGLDRVDDDGDRARVEAFKRLGGVSASGREHGRLTLWVLMSTLESQQPKPGWEWYHPTTISGLRIHQWRWMRCRGAHLPVCLSISTMRVWKTWSTDSTVTLVPLWGMAKTSMTWTCSRRQTRRA